MKRSINSIVFTSVIVVFLLLGLCLAVIGYDEAAGAESPPTTAWLHQFGGSQSSLGADDSYVATPLTTGEGGVTLATEHTIRPTKTVAPDHAVSQNDTGPFTYTIALEQVSDNCTNGLDVIYDIQSDEFKGKAQDLYVPGSSYISEDGLNWEPISDPKTDFNSNQLLRWPATGNFSSPFRDFTPGQVKYLRFQMNGPFCHDDVVVCNSVVLKVGDVFTLSGPQAPITVGNPTVTVCTDDSAMLEVSKTSNPQAIPSYQATNVTYTITITNADSSTNFVIYIEDYLPPGFTYVGPTTTDMTDPENQGPHPPELVTVNGVERYKLVWDETQLGVTGFSIAAGANATLTLVACAEQGIPGNYYNEVIVVPKNYPAPMAFDDIDGFPESGYGEAYSWNTGTVTVVDTNPLVSIAVTPPDPSIALGQTQQFTAIGTYTDNSTPNITSDVTWVSSNASVATIDTSGLATSIAEGTTPITATSDNVSGNTTLTVTALEPITWYVDDDLTDYPNADFTKIQDAVNAASANDTIIVYAGTYTENIDINTDNLTIHSENGANSRCSEYH